MEKEFETSGDVMRREIEIKKWNRKKKEALVAGASVGAVGDLLQV